MRNLDIFMLGVVECDRVIERGPEGHIRDDCF